MQLQIAKVDLFSVIERSVGSMRGFAEKHSVTIEEPPQSKEEIDADGDRLVQVLVNLLSNAIKFSPAGSVVKISVVDRGSDVEVRVQDQGRGIPKTHFKSIFERFQQVEAADARDKEGTGLGLPICKSIVQQHGGTIGVESEVGKGATFWLRLPRAATPAISAKWADAIHLW